MNRSAYDAFSTDYDKFVNWDARLSVEMPFIESLLARAGAEPRILDAACGTGVHSIALAQKGYRVAGADYSQGMVEQARANAAASNVDIRFEQAGFGDLAGVYGEGKFDVVMCLGNSLPHVQSREILLETLVDFRKVLRPGGILLIQNRNFDRVVLHQERWMDPQAYQRGEDEWIFLRFYDYLPDGTIKFNIVTLSNKKAAGWKQSITSTPLIPLLSAEVTQALMEAGYDKIHAYGNMQGGDYEQLTSDNLVITALNKGE